MELGEFRWNSRLCPVQGKKRTDTSSYRKVDVCCWIVVLVLLACIMDIKIQFRNTVAISNIFFLIFINVGENFLNLSQAVRYRVMCIKTYTSHFTFLLDHPCMTDIHVKHVYKYSVPASWHILHAHYKDHLVIAVWEIIAAYCNYRIHS